MHKVALFTVAAALILVGLGSWAASTTQARIDTPTNVRTDVLQMMTNAGNLPTDRIADYSVVFD